jgi:hypothetical protein
MSTDRRVVASSVPKVREIEKGRNEPQVESQTGEVAALGEERRVERTSAANDGPIEGLET